MRKTLLFKNKIVLSFAMTLIMFLSCLITVETSFATPWPFAAGTVPVPTPVDGRVLPSNLTGDSSEWLEIAQNGNYSLILRRNFLNIYPNAVMNGKVVLNDPASQWTSFGYYTTTTNYQESRIRDRINEWFNSSNPVTNQADRLSLNARIRDYVMHSSAIAVLGTGSTKAASINGFSRPTIYQVGIGNDMAFALSFAEAGNFLSKSMFIRDNYYGTVYNPAVPSNSIAAANYDKISIPTATNCLYFMWLRSPGDTPNTVTTLESTQNAGSVGRVFQFHSAPTNQNGRDDRGLIYPALWVHQGIFSNNPNQPKPLPTPPPYPVDGRILPPNLTGDTSDWIEIARSGNNSLIVRRNFINLYSVKVSGTKILYNDPLWQYTAFGTNASYPSSRLREKINEWFNCTAPLTSQADRLPGSARLRNFTLQNNAVYVLGTSTTHQAVVNGYSMPSIYQQGIGPDVAFALSYGESASYLSLLHFLRGEYIANQPSSPLAVSNYNKVNIPIGSNYATFMWLRSPGDVANSAASLESKKSSIVGGRAFQMKISDIYGLVYPALWVGQGIFGTTATVIVQHRDAANMEPLEVDMPHTVSAPGNYGPYYANTYPGYGAGYLAMGSAPASGTVNIDDTKTVTYLYPKNNTATIIIRYFNLSDGVLLEPETEITIHNTPANYGPYEPKKFDGFKFIDYPDPNSAPRSGIIQTGETLTIIFNYTSTN